MVMLAGMTWVRVLAVQRLALGGPVEAETERQVESPRLGGQSRRFLFVATLGLGRLRVDGGSEKYRAAAESRRRCGCVERRRLSRAALEQGSNHPAGEHSGGDYSGEQARGLTKRPIERKSRLGTVGKGGRLLRFRARQREPSRPPSRGSVCSSQTNLTRCGGSRARAGRLPTVTRFDWVNR